MAMKAWLGRRSRDLVSKTFGFATDLTNTSQRSAARTMPKARLTYLPQLDRIAARLDPNMLLQCLRIEITHKKLRT